jgi:small subunit ribosomal protein S2
MMLLNQLIRILTLVTAAIVEGLSDRSSDKKVKLLLKLLLHLLNAVELPPAVEAAA